MPNYPNKPIPIVILGGGYAYHEIFGLIQDINAIELKFKIIGVLDDNPQLHGRVYNGVPLLGPLNDWNSYPEEVKFILAIGSYNTRFNRWAIVKRLSIPLERFATLLHPTAKIYQDTNIGQGCIIHFGSLINSKTILEPHVLISAMSVIGVENLVGEGVLIASGVVTTTNVRIGSYSFLGAGATIGPDVELGAGSMASAGSVVLKNVLAGENTLGNPSRSFHREDVPSRLLNLWENCKTSYANKSKVEHG